MIFFFDDLYVSARLSSSLESRICPCATFVLVCRPTCLSIWLLQRHIFDMPELHTLTTSQAMSQIRVDPQSSLISIFKCVCVYIYIYTYIQIYIYIYMGVCVDLSLSLLSLSVLLSIYLSIYLSICLYLSIYPSIHLSIYLSIYLFIYLSIYLSIYLCNYLSMSLSICLSICLSSIHRKPSFSEEKDGLGQKTFFLPGKNGFPTGNRVGPTGRVLGCFGRVLRGPANQCSTEEVKHPTFLHYTLNSKPYNLNPTP